MCNLLYDYVLFVSYCILIMLNQTINTLLSIILSLIFKTIHLNISLVKNIVNEHGP